MNRIIKNSALLPCSAKIMLTPRRPVVFTRSGLREEVVHLNSGKSHVEELSGETNTMVADVMDIDRTPELLAWLFSGIFKGRAKESELAPTTPSDKPTSTTSIPNVEEATQRSSAVAEETPPSAAPAASSPPSIATQAAASSSTTLYSDANNGDLHSTASSSSAADVGSNIEVATVGGGCFWCIEACFRELQGVLSVTSGYAGGHVTNPTYQQVCTKTTGHAEVVQIEYDRSVLSYKELLQIFMSIHDPTTPNRSGNDVGPQYRSIILTHCESQAAVAAEVLGEANRALWFGRKVCTEVASLQAFYPAESYHQRYYVRNPDAGYCLFVVRPKLMEFRRGYAARLKR